MKKVIIIGAGAAGMLAAIFCARNGNQVKVLEKNEKLGKKLFITGKGRCNLTNGCDADELLNNLVTNRKFMYSAFSNFSNYDTMGFFSELGLDIKTERGERVFPVSDKSSDVIQVLQKEMRKLGVSVSLNTRVKKVIQSENRFDSVVTSQNERIPGDCLIIATGGNSYQSTGSTGEGYEFAEELGHSITDILPALVPLVVREEWIKTLQGLNLRNVRVNVYDEEQLLYSDFGEMSFTNFGVTGPTVLSASSYIVKLLKKKTLKMTVDLKPALSFEQLDERILRDFSKELNQIYKKSLNALLPQKLIPIIVELSHIKEEKKINEITKEERHNLVHLLKNLPFTLTGPRGFNEAIITQGGVDVKEINPSTMESKLVKNVYFAGEILDVDAVTGGFNLQIAWSSAYACAKGIGL